VVVVGAAVRICSGTSSGMRRDTEAVGAASLPVEPVA